MAKVKSVKGIFRVHGVNKQVVTKAVHKSLDTFKVDGQTPTESEYNTEFQRRYREKFEKMKPTAISQPFSTPQMAYEYIDITKRTTPCDEYKDLHVAIHRSKLDGNKEPLINPKTGKVIKYWSAYEGADH